MKTGIIKHVLLLLLFANLNPQLSTFAQGTAFTYQGQLLNSGSPAGGLYDFRFRLDADPAGNTILGTVFTNAIPVSNGLFTTTIDFGPGWFNGSNYWLEVAVRTNTGGGGSYMALNPLQPLTPAPYAVFANTASNVSGTVSAAQLSGAVASANLSGTYGNAVTLNNAGNSFAGSFNGNGAGLTGLNASQLTSIGNTNGGFNNFFIGSAGDSSTSGTDNTAAGSGSLSLITSGHDNTANGWQSLYLNASGIDNTAIGSAALEYNMTGSYNTAVGASAFAGSFSFAGSNNIALGYQAGFNLLSGNSDIYIGNSGNNGENNTIRIGSSQTNTFIAGVINGNGGGLTNLNVSASQLTSIGNTNGGFNNFFIGSAGYSAASGFDNTAAGSGSLSVISSGHDNTANGWQSLYLNGSGSDNTAVGSAALQYNMTGSFNTAVGASTFAGGFTFAGSNNIALGYQAGFNLLSGNFDIYIGNSGNNGENNTIRIGSSQTNTFIAGVINGNGAGLTGLNASQLTGALPAISGASLTSLNASSLSSGTVALARLPALNLVNVSGALPSSTTYTVSGNTTGGINNAVALVINNNTSGSDAPALRVIGSGSENSGVLSVSSQNPQLTGLLAQFGNSNAFVVSITNDGTIYCKATMLSSDRNVKENFQALDVRSVLDKLAALPVTEWNYKDDAADRKHIGPMAQDFYAAFGLDGNDDRHISTVDEGGVALAAIQGLNQKLNEKDARILAQASEIAELKTRLEKLERLMTEKISGAK